MTHRRHGIDGNVSGAWLQLQRVARVDVPHRRVLHGASGALGLHRVALRGARSPVVERRFLEVSLGARRRRRRRSGITGLGARHGGHVGMLLYVGVRGAREVRGRLHGLTAGVVESWEQESDG